MRPHTHTAYAQVIYISGFGPEQADLAFVAQHADYCLGELLDDEGVHALYSERVSERSWGDPHGHAERWRWARHTAAAVMWHRRHPVLAALTVHADTELTIAEARQYRAGVLEGITDATGPLAASITGRIRHARQHQSPDWADGYAAGAAIAPRLNTALAA